MSSGQWEVVSRSKKDKGPKKLSKTEKKVFIENAPKVEDICKIFNQHLFKYYWIGL